jgi:hypothetical protein
MLSIQNKEQEKLHRAIILREYLRFTTETILGEYPKPFPDSIAPIVDV